MADLELEKELSLEDRMLMYRSANDTKLPRNSYVLMMLDGRSFSRMVKKRFELPFDSNFINAMNKTAEHLCREIQGAKFAYVQSDEISIFLTDVSTEQTGAFFDYRLVKMLSVSASIATSFFNREMTKLYIKEHNGTLSETDVDSLPLYEFDCKAWTVPNKNDVFAWFLYRQNDCIRNSKQQASQTYIPHNKLKKKHTDEQIQMLKEINGINWNDYSSGEKYGRFIFKETFPMNREINGQSVDYERSVWKARSFDSPLNSLSGKQEFWSVVDSRELIPEKSE